MTDEEATDISPLARTIQEYRDYVRGKQSPLDHQQKVVPYEDVGDTLDSILDDHDAQEPPLELVVEFRQRFTIQPPDEITDPVHATDWFWNIYPELGNDAVDPKRKDHYEVLAARPRGFDD